MKPRNQWMVFRGKILVIVGVSLLIVAIFLPNRIPETLTPLVVLFGVGFFAMAVPLRLWKKVPGLFQRDDSWL